MKEKYDGVCPAISAFQYRRRFSRHDRFRHPLMKKKMEELGCLRPEFLEMMWTPRQMYAFKLR
jgi:hypothetical protein